MKSLYRFLSRLRGAVLPGRTDADLSEELESHIRMQIEDNLRAGVPPETARRTAVLKFGGVESVKLRYRDQRGLPPLETFLGDLRYAVRTLRATGGFTLTAVLVLALGIGATTAIFSVVNAVLLKPLGIVDADRLVMLMTTGLSDTGQSISDSDASPTKFEHWQTLSTVLQDVAAFDRGFVNYTGGEVVEQWRAMRTSANFFRCWGIQILEGRIFTTEEDLPNGPRVAVINRDLWTRRFASSSQILGHTISLNGEPYSVIGIGKAIPDYVRSSRIWRRTCSYRSNWSPIVATRAITSRSSRASSRESHSIRRRPTCRRLPARTAPSLPIPSEPWDQPMDSR